MTTNSDPTNPWKYFKYDEFKCKHCGENHMESSFIDKLDLLREECGFPLAVTSGYRCPDHNEAVSTTGRNGPHTTGRACDLRCNGRQAFVVLREAFALGLFTGVGVQQRGEVRFIHLDDMDTAPRPNVWSY